VVAQTHRFAPGHLFAYALAASLGAHRGGSGAAFADALDEVLRRFRFGPAFFMEEGRRMDDSEVEIRMLSSSHHVGLALDARAAVDSARAALDSARTTLELHTVRAPVAGEVLQVNVRPGEFAQAGRLADPLLRLGTPRPYHVRVDFNEEEAGLVDPGAPAEAFARGDTAKALKLAYVRTEPYVTPKRSLTGAPTERVDTRVLQVLYALQADAPVQVGQQLDVFVAREDGAGVAKP